MKKWLQRNPVWEDHVSEVKAFGHGGLPGRAMLSRVKGSMMKEWGLSEMKWDRLMFDAGLKEVSRFGQTYITSSASTRESLDTDDPNHWTEECADDHEQMRLASHTSKKRGHRRG